MSARSAITFPRRQVVLPSNDHKTTELVSDAPNLSKSLQFLNWSVAICTIANAVWLMTATDLIGGQGTSARFVFGAILLFVWFVAYIVFAISLGKCAARLGLLWFDWVGATMLTAPIGGPLVAYFLIRKRVISAIPNRRSLLDVFLDKTTQVVKVLATGLFFAAISLLSLWGAFAIWPSDFFSTPFSQMTLGMLLQALSSPLLAICGLGFGVAALGQLTELN